MSGYLKKDTVESETGPVDVFTITRREILTQQAIDGCRAEIEAIDPSTRIVLDLHHIDRVASSFVSALLQLQRGVHRAGGRLSICNANAMLTYTIQTLRLDRVFALNGSVEEAVRAVAGKA